MLVGVALIWKERIGQLRWLLIGFGIVGALMVAQPDRIGLRHSRNRR